MYRKQPLLQSAASVKSLGDSFDHLAELALHHWELQLDEVRNMRDLNAAKGFDKSQEVLFHKRAVQLLREM